MTTMPAPRGLLVPGYGLIAEQLDLIDIYGGHRDQAPPLALFRGTRLGPDHPGLEAVLRSGH